MNLHSTGFSVAAAQLVAEIESRQQHDAAAGERSRAIHQTVVRMQRAVDRHGVQLAVRADQPPLARRAQQRIHDAVVLEQILGPLRRAALREVGGRCAQHLPARRDLARDQVRVLQPPDAHGDVEAFLDEVDLAIVEAQLDA